MDKGLWTVSLFLVVVGILFLTGGTLCLVYQNCKEKFTGRAAARVVDLFLEDPGEQKRTVPYKNIYYPVLEYYAEGKLYKTKYPKGSYPSRFHLNQEIMLNYNTEDPLDYEIAETGWIKQLPRILYSIGVLSVSLACIIFLRFALRG